MKKSIYGVLTFAALLFTACSEENTKETANGEEKIVAEYVINTEESKLEWSGSWAGGDNDGNTHYGVIDIKEGTIAQDGDEFQGHLKVDMKTIDAQDLDEESGRSRLLNRLESEVFFNTEAFANTDVKINEIADGQASITLVIAGVEMSTTVPVNVKVKDDVLTINGDFTIDVKEIEMAGMQLNAEKPEQGTVSSEISFKLHSVYNKK